MGVIEIINSVFKIFNDILIPLAFAFCLLFFFWGVAKYIKDEGNGKSEGKKIMIWGIVGLFIAFSIWGIVKFIETELGLPSINALDIPLTEGTKSNIIFPPKED